MLDFRLIKTAVQKQFAYLTTQPMFRTAATGDLLWETYLNAFPEGTNPTYKERTEHDCSCCRQFIRAVGNAVIIRDGRLVSLWDVQTGDPDYDAVCAAMSAAVKAHPIENVFLHFEPRAGADKTWQEIVGGTPIQWEHFFVNIPLQFVLKGEQLGTYLNHTRTSFETLHRALTELTTDAVDTVLELIAQNSLYRGEEHQPMLQQFRTLQRSAATLSVEELPLLCWTTAVSSYSALCRIRNTVIGSLLVDLSEGKDLEGAVKSFELKVAPTNYKRPTALVTKGMIAQAQKTVEELGYLSALDRRHAQLTDVSVNNVLYADRDAKKVMPGNVFEELAATTAKVSAKSFDKVEEVSIEKFLADIMPKATSLELFLDNNHSGNLVSLIAPADATSKSMFKWGNNFSWAYNGELADSMKERVKAAGGAVDGDLRFSIQWNDEDVHNRSDYDAHCMGPKYLIYYGHKRDPKSGGCLDVDITRPENGVPAVENITFPDRNHMVPGEYKFLVHAFSAREGDTGFRAEIEFDGVIHAFNYPKPVRNGNKIHVASVHYDGKGNFTLEKALDTSHHHLPSKTVWGLPTPQFHKVSLVMNSPNHWDGQGVGNRHYFFMIDGCKNPDQARGFFNEFLSNDLAEHRKVFEVLGTKLRVPYSDHQLSGLGFSSTQRSSVLCRVQGSFNRVVRINF